MKKLTRGKLRRLIRKELSEAKYKTVYRNGKKVRKLDCPKGKKAKDGKCVRMSSKEKRRRSKAAKKGHKKKSSYKKGSKKRKKTNRKRS